MSAQIPGDYQTFLNLPTEAIQRLTDELVLRPLTAETIEAWLDDWTKLWVLFQESLARIDIHADLNPTDSEAEERRHDYRQAVWTIGEKFEAAMVTRLLEHEAMVPQAIVPFIRQTQSQRSVNQSDELMVLVNQEVEVLGEYWKILGTPKSIQWRGETLSIEQAEALLTSEYAGVHDGIQQALKARQQQESEAISVIWRKMLDLRQARAEKNGCVNYIEYRWHELGRTEYSPDDCHALHNAFERYWTPLYERIMVKDPNNPHSLSPSTDTPVSEEDLKAYTNGRDLVARVGKVFHRLDAEFGAEFDRHVRIGLLDIPDEVDPSKGGGFARVVGRTGVFVRVNISGNRWDVVGLIHEMGHVFGLMASAKHPCHLLWRYAQDFMETPSSVMEMLSIPYWDEFYQGVALSRVRREYFRAMVINNLETVISEAFQLWAYSHLNEARNVAQCSAKWLELYEQYMPNGDWQEWRENVLRGWQYMVLLFHAPLFAMEYVYGRLAGLNLMNAPDAIARYKQATRLGGSVGVKELFTTLGTHFFFTAEDVANAAKQIESHLVS